MAFHLIFMDIVRLSRNSMNFNKFPLFSLDIRGLSVRPWIFPHKVINLCVICYPRCTMVWMVLGQYLYAVCAKSPTSHISRISMHIHIDACASKRNSHWESEQERSEHRTIGYYRTDKFIYTSSSPILDSQVQPCFSRNKRAKD